MMTSKVESARRGAFWTVLLPMFAFLLVLSQPQQAAAQWTSPDAQGNINSTNTGRVGIGVSAPSRAKVEVWGDDGVAAGEHGLFYASRAGTGSGGVMMGYRANGTSVQGGYLRGISNLPLFLGSTTVPEAMTIIDNGNTGFGTTAPQAQLHVSSSSTAINRGIVNEQKSADALSAMIIFTKSRAGGAVLNGDNIGNLFTAAFDGTTMVNSARVKFAVDGPVSANNVPTSLQFHTGTGGNGGLERMRVTSAGNVGIGTATPAARLDVTTTNAVGAGTLDLVFGDGVAANNNPITISHKVGTTNGSLSRIGFNIYSNSSSFALVNPTVGGWAMQSDTRNGITAPSLQFSSFTTSPVKTDVLTLTQGGSVGIGITAPAAMLHVAGDIRVDGNISAKYQDVAEWVPSTQRLAAGTVVVVDAGGVNHVLASTAAYDTGVAGVISAQPGLLLGEGGEGQLKVATTGRVKVRVDATRAPIRAGDLLVTSGVEGVAMRSEPVSFGGVAMHRPGTIIGKALESLERGTGEILVLLSLQ